MVRVVCVLLTTAAAMSLCWGSEISSSVGYTTTLVESLPYGDFDLTPFPGQPSTADALIALTRSATETLDVTVMYWSLLVPNTTDFSPADLKRFGAERGSELYEELSSAAARGVHLRILDGSGISAFLPAELQELQRRHPGMVTARTWNATAWYGGGIMHQKVWIVDGGRGALYVGSSNLDWLSLTQVKELGVLIKPAAGGDQSTWGQINTPGKDAAALFESWWLWAGLEATTAMAYDPTLRVERTVPCWSHIVDPVSRCPDPFRDTFQEAKDPSAPTHTQLSHNVPNGLQDGLPAGFVLSGSPVELLGNSARPWDLDVILATIYGARSTLCLSVMDILPANLYGGSTVGYITWNPIFEAIQTAVVTHGVQVRLLSSNWAHTTIRQEAYLRWLKQGTTVCQRQDSLPEFSGEPRCSGTLQIRIFEVPGWNSTKGHAAAYPAYSRVNHAKYLVSEGRANIGTSNWPWGYMYNTAGTSFNTDDEGVVTATQAVFDRDWESRYAKDLEE